MRNRGMLVVHTVGILLALTSLSGYLLTLWAGQRYLAHNGWRVGWELGLIISSNLTAVTAMSGVAMAYYWAISTDSRRTLDGSTPPSHRRQLR